MRRLRGIRAPRKDLLATAMSSVLAATLFAATLLAAPVLGQGAASDYRLGPGDRLSIQVDELTQINGEVVIQPDGTIEIPRLGFVVLRDQTVEQARERLRDRLAAMGVRHPTVHLQIVEYGSRPVSVLGAVANPGNELIRGSARLFDVLLRRGGVGPGHGAAIQISRQADNGLRDQIEISVEDLIANGDPTANIPIAPGDRILVPAAREITYFIVGEVAQAGPVTISATQNETLLTAIARSGGLADNASNKIEIVRRGPDGLYSIFAHYGRIIGHRENDIPIQDGDIIRIKESFF